jgi:hypothetical protein
VTESFRIAEMSRPMELMLIFVSQLTVIDPATWRTTLPG